MKKELGLGILCAIIIGIFCIFAQGVSVYNTHISLKNQIEAKQKSNEASFDTMWKKIQQVSNVSDKYKDGLKEILIAYTDGRKDVSKDMLMKWGNEAVPNFDSSLYKQVNNVITSSRDDFYRDQQILLDLNRQHNQFIEKFPNNIYCAILHIEKIDVKVVTSSKTEKTFESGKEDDIKL